MRGLNAAEFLALSSGATDDDTVQGLARAGRVVWFWSASGGTAPPINIYVVTEFGRAALRIYSRWMGLA